MRPNKITKRLSSTDHTVGQSWLEMAIRSMIDLSHQFDTTIRMSDEDKNLNT